MAADDEPDLTSLHGRLEWILEHRSSAGHRGKKRRPSQRALSLEAHLGASFLGTLLNRLRAGKPAELGVVPAAALAKAAGVRLQWLATGEGPRDVSEPEERPDPRSEAARLCLEAGVYEPAVRAVEQEALDPAAPPRSVIWWIDRMRGTALKLMAAAANPLPPNVTPPTGVELHPPESRIQPTNGNRGEPGGGVDAVPKKPPGR